MSWDVTLSDSHGRVAWIDLAKGLGICLMTFGHVDAYPGGGLLLPALHSATEWIYLFHMPAFFLLGGLTFRRAQQWHSFVVKKIKTLLVPYLFFSLYFLAKAAVTAGGTDVVSAVMTSVIDVYIFGHGLWFLAAYFVGELIAYVILDVVHCDGVACVAVGLILYVLSFVCFDVIDVYLLPMPPFELVNGCKAAGLICVGSSLRPLLPATRPSGTLFPVLALFLSAIAFGVSGVQALSDAIVIPRWFAEAIAALSGSLMLVFLALLMANNALLTSIGRQSLAYYVVAPELTNVVKLFVLAALGSSVDVTELSAAFQWVLGLTMTVAILALSWPVCRLIRRLMPWSLGVAHRMPH